MALKEMNKKIAATVKVAIRTKNITAEMMKFKKGNDLSIEEVIKYVEKHHPELKDDDIEFALANLVCEVLDGVFVPGDGFQLFRPETYSADVIKRIHEIATRVTIVEEAPVTVFGSKVVNFQ